MNLKIIDGIEGVLKVAKLLGAFIVMVIAAYTVFAKASDFEEYKQLDQAQFQEFKKEIDREKVIERAYWLEEQIFKYKDRYGENYEKADDLTKEQVRKWETELKLKWLEVKEEK